ncbi:MAG: 4Fe-4S dicluster domain-containing protein, partial [Proteobacteria bacterium]|nr:4Fe-4S dicluster domain-containing protein [Pseudomonadota bacterium]
MSPAARAPRPPLQQAPLQRAADPLVALADRCVQCGLCLPACPTYGSDRVEAESPRGRIALARAWALQTIEPTPTGEAHLDHCLGCGNCETVCPAGVQYDELLVAARARQRERRAPAWRQRWGEALAARPRRLHMLLALYRHLYRWLPAQLRPLPRPPTFSNTAPVPPPVPHGATVALFIGCVAGPYEAGLRAAVVRLCAALGIDTIAPPRQTCCGSLHAHAGDLDQADRLATTNRAAFAGATTVLTLASGCHQSVARALDGETAVVDALGFLDQHSARLRFNARQERVALHLPCTQRNAVKSVPALRRLLAQVPDLQVVELDAGYGCCGAAGLNMFTEPERAAGYRQPLLDQFAASGATAVALAQTVQRDRLRHSLDAAEAERRRWARELHDETLQGLGALRVILSSAVRRAEQDDLAESLREGRGV